MINRQQHTSTCGIVATVNATQWANNPVSFKDAINWFTDLYGFKHKGINIDYVRATLKDLDIKTSNISKPTFTDIEKEIDKGNAVILLYKWYYKGRNGGHFVFIDSYTDKTFNVWNFSSRNKTPRINKEKIAKKLRYSYRWHEKDYPDAIVIKRKK